jgi:hypothetical protein
VLLRVVPKEEEACIGWDCLPVHDPGALHANEELLQVVEPPEALASRRTLACIGLDALRVDLLHRGITDRLQFPVLQPSVVCQLQHL